MATGPQFKDGGGGGGSTTEDSSTTEEETTRTVDSDGGELAEPDFTDFDGDGSGGDDQTDRTVDSSDGGELAEPDFTDFDGDGSGGDDQTDRTVDSDGGGGGGGGGSSSTGAGDQTGDGDQTGARTPTGGSGQNGDGPAPTVPDSGDGGIDDSTADDSLIVPSSGRVVLGTFGTGAAGANPNAPTAGDTRQGVETAEIAAADDDGRGVEETGSAEIKKAARDLEDQVLRNNPELGGDRSLVTVRREGNSLVASLTERGRQVIERERARQLESDLLADLGLEDPDLVRVTKEGDELVASLTLEGVERVASPELEAQLEDQLGVDLDRDDFTLVFGEEGIGAELTAEGVSKVRSDRRAEAEARRREALDQASGRARREVLGEDGRILGLAAAQAEAESRQEEIGDALEGVGFFDEAAERRQGAVGEVERALERQVGTARAAALGITGAGPTRAIIERTDLRQGEDFDLEVTQTEDGLSIGASLTEEFRREFAEDVIESRLESSTGADLDPGVDFNVVFGDDGSATPVLTDRGRGRIALTNLDRTVEDLEAGRIPIVTDLTGIQGPEVDLVGGEGPAAPEARSTSALESERGGPLRDLEAEISGAAASARAGLRSGEGTLRSPFTGERFLGQDVLEPLVAGGLRGAVDLGEQAGTLPLRFGDFLLAGNEAVDEDIERILAGETPTESAEFARQASAAGGRLPFVAASGLIGEVRDRPTRTLGALAGSLGVSAAAMRLLPASRFVIQPGEEALGSAGFGATRRLAGERRAQQLFPNREPLIFSEEFAIRQARRLRDRVVGSEIEAEGSRPVTTDPDLPPPRPDLLRIEDVDAGMGVSGPGRLDLARGRARRGLESARGQVGDLLESVNVRSGRIGAGFGAVEIEIETESEGDVIRDFDPSRSEVLGGGASETARQEMVSRQREARQMMGGDFEGAETDPIEGANRRLAEAEARGLDLDRLTRGQEARLEAATEPALLRLEAALGSSLSTDLAGLSLLEAAAEAQATRQRTRLREDLETFSEVDQEPVEILMGEFDLAQQFELLETDLEVGAEVEAETDLESEIAEAEVETEAETEAELRAETLAEARLEGDRDEAGGRRERDPLEALPLAIGGTSEADLLPGFVSETVADIGLAGGRSGRAPPEDVLEAIVEADEAPVEELPTFEEILGTPEEREAISEARGLFSFGGRL